MGSWGGGVGVVELGWWGVCGWRLCGEGYSIYYPGNVRQASEVTAHVYYRSITQLMASIREQAEPLMRRSGEPAGSSCSSSTAGSPSVLRLSLCLHHMGIAKALLFTTYMECSSERDGERGSERTQAHVFIHFFNNYIGCLYYLNLALICFFVYWSS